MSERDELTAVPALLALIRARERAATRGPWKTEPVERGKFAGVEARVFSLRGSHILLSPTDGEAGQAKTADAAFIAAARTDIPRLLAALDGVEAIMNEMDETAATRAVNPHIKDYYATRIRAAVVAALQEGE